MAKANNSPASSPESVSESASDNEKWSHIVADKDGSLAFGSRDEAEAFAKDHGIGTYYTGDEKSADGKSVKHSNIEQIGTVHVIMNPSIKSAKKASSSDDSKQAVNG